MDTLETSELMTIGRFARITGLTDGRESVMSTPVEAIDHRRLGVDLFNKTWTLMEKDDRTEAEDDELLHCAHASAYHWLQVGTQANRARSEWHCSRMYTVLGRAEPALYHARRCLELCESNPEALEDWDVPFAHEALSRAYVLAGDQAEARRHEERARELGERIEGAEDRRLLEADLATLYY